MKKLIVTQNVVDEFLYTARRDNTVRQFWIDIVKNMPQKLKQEVRSKPTYLVEMKNIDDTTSKLKFLTDNASKRLQDYLNKFLVLSRPNH
jgi:hypothetical protein